MDDEDEFEIEDDKYKLAYKHDGKKFYYLESEENDTPLLYIEDEGDLKHVGDWDLRKKQAIFEDIDEAKENNWIIN